MQEIPDISFKETQQVPGFEMIDLQELLSRNLASLDHNPYQAHKLTFFGILILTEAKVNHWVDFGTHCLKKGESLLLSKGRVHAFDAQNPYRGKLLIFTEEFLLANLAPSPQAKINRLYNYFLNPSLFLFPEGNNALIQALQAELTPPNGPNLANIVAALLSIYLLKLEAQSQKTSPHYAFDRNYEIFASFKWSVENRYRLSRNASDHARELGVSYKHLNTICKGFTNKTAKAFIDDYILLEIKRYLSGTTLSIKEICYQCGFDEPTNFLKYFKKASGMTPVSFREQLQ